ncbi:MAG: hypothetical protein AAB328_09550, partial [candidate division NC10 bacterium]
MKAAELLEASQSADLAARRVSERFRSSGASSLAVWARASALSRSPPCSDSTQARLLAAGAKRADVLRVDIDGLADPGEGLVVLPRGGVEGAELEIGP